MRPKQEAFDAIKTVFGGQGGTGFAVSRREGESYDAYMNRVLDTEGAAALKVADMEDNTLRSLGCLDKAGMVKRYAKYYPRLVAEERADILDYADKLLAV